MSELVEQMLNGDDCERCGVPFHDAGQGIPRRCAGCQPNPPYASKAARIRAKKDRARDRRRTLDQTKPGVTP